MNNLRKQEKELRSSKRWQNPASKVFLALLFISIDFFCGVTSAAIYSYTLKCFFPLFIFFKDNFPSFQKKFSLPFERGTPKNFLLHFQRWVKFWEENVAWNMKWMMLCVISSFVVLWKTKLSWNFLWEKIRTPSHARESKQKSDGSCEEPFLCIAKIIREKRRERILSRVIRRFHECAESATNERASNAQRCNIPSAHIQLPLSPQIVKIARPLAEGIVKRIFVCYIGAAEKVS